MNYSVYLVQSGDNKNSPTKIGVTKDIDNRLKAMQTGNPYPLHCRALIPCKTESEAYRLETYLHSRLSKRRVRNEWFNLYGQNLKPIIEGFNINNESKCKIDKCKKTTDYKRRVKLLEVENKKLRKALIDNGNT